MRPTLGKQEVVFTTCCFATHHEAKVLRLGVLGSFGTPQCFLVLRIPSIYHSAAIPLTSANLLMPRPFIQGASPGKHLVRASITQVARPRNCWAFNCEAVPPKLLKSHFFIFRTCMYVLICMTPNLVHSSLFAGSACHSFDVFIRPTIAKPVTNLTYFVRCF